MLNFDSTFVYIRQLNNCEEMYVCDIHLSCRSQANIAKQMYR